MVFVESVCVCRTWTSASIPVPCYIYTADKRAALDSPTAGSASGRCGQQPDYFHHFVSSRCDGIPPPQTLLYLSSLRQPEASLSFSLADCDRLLRCPVDPNWSDPAEAEEED